MASILVVDDDADIRVVICMTLESAGHAVAVARDGSEGLALFQSRQLDLVITDVFMPERDGVEFLRMISAKAGPTPVLVISGGGVWPQETANLLDAMVHLGATRTCSSRSGRPSSCASSRTCCSDDDAAGQGAAWVPRRC